jgi:hypothetical protein
VIALSGVYNCILPFCRRSKLVVCPGGLCLVVGDAQNSEAVAPVVKEIKHFTIVIKHYTIAINHFTIVIKHYTIAINHFTIVIKHYMIVIKHFTIVIKIFTIVINHFTIVFNECFFQLLLNGAIQKT